MLSFPGCYKLENKPTHCWDLSLWFSYNNELTFNTSGFDSSCIPGKNMPSDILDPYQSLSIDFLLLRGKNEYLSMRMLFRSMPSYS